jgi:hypothetical protein
VDVAQVLYGVLGIAVLFFSIGLLLWVAVVVPICILRKAGFESWLVVPVQLTFPFSWIFVALADWPMHRELAWLRMKTGDPSPIRVSLIEGHAIDLEQRGEWKKAIEVYEELARRGPSPKGSDYYRNCSNRLLERLE